MNTVSTAPEIRLSRRIDLSAISALFGMSVARLIRGRRLIVLVLLYSLPIAIAILVRHFNEDYSPGEAETALIFAMIPQALAPITALLFASGMVQDEIEEQTLTYLLVRPLPRWAIYLTKLVATFLVTALLAALFTTATYAAVHWGEANLFSDVLLIRAPKTAALLAMSLACYSAVFGLISLFVKRALVVGIVYTIVFEGVLANIDFVVRRGTIMYYFRVLCVSWLGLKGEDWSIDLELSPDPTSCATTMLAIAATAAVLAAWSFSVREFRLKTPEGN